MKKFKIKQLFEEEEPWVEKYNNYVPSPKKKIEIKKKKKKI